MIKCLHNLHPYVCEQLGHCCSECCDFVDWNIETDVFIMRRRSNGALVTIKNASENVQVNAEDVKRLGKGQ